MPKETCHLRKNLSVDGKLKISGELVSGFRPYGDDETELASLPPPNGKLGMLALSVSLPACHTRRVASGILGSAGGEKVSPIIIPRGFSDTIEIPNWSATITQGANPPQRRRGSRQRNQNRK
jgi:hypothetical protein